MKSNWIHRIILSIIFSVVNWFIISNLWIEMSLFEYIIIELFIVISLKVYIFVCSKTGINKEN
jgi:hypothetical protein